jgi:heme A synthase
MTDMQATLQERRRRRRARRIVVAVASVAVLILGGLWLNSTKPTMTCSEWQAEYSNAVLQNNGSGTQVNLEHVRPEGCPIPLVPGG